MSIVIYQESNIPQIVSKQMYSTLLYLTLKEGGKITLPPIQEIDKLIKGFTLQKHSIRNSDGYVIESQLIALEGKSL
jgi:hypothetical protein